MSRLVNCPGCGAPKHEDVACHYCGRPGPKPEPVPGRPLPLTVVAVDVRREVQIMSDGTETQLPWRRR